MARRIYTPQPNTPRGRADAQITGGGDGWANPESSYDASAGVPTALTAGDVKVDLNPSPFTARPATSTGVTTQVPDTSSKGAL